MQRLKKSLLASGLVLFSFAGLALGETAPKAPEDQLDQIIAARSEQDIARDSARHPAETLAFFQVKPGMTVAEALPEGEWYTRILAPYLGAKGKIYGVNYADEIWQLFGFMDDKQIAANIASTDKFPAKVAKITGNGIKARGFTFSTAPEKTYKTVDRFLIIRALHNLNRFEAKTGSRSQALSAVRVLLKKDGLVGVVQHRIPETADEAVPSE